MGKALQIVSGFVASTTGTSTPDPVTNNTGDSTAIRNYSQGSESFILDQWATDGTGTNAPVIQQIKSPLMHDNVDGIQTSAPVGTAQSLWPGWVRERVFAQDVLSVNMIDNGGGGVGPVAESFLAYYDDLPGANARLFRWAELVGNIDQVMGVQVAITSSGATAGDYDGPTAINATNDQFKANRDYAIFGATVDVELGTIGIFGPDTSNLRVGIPGSASLTDQGRDYFIRLSEDSGKPCIPVFNSANKNATIVDITDPNANAPAVVVLFCARLKTNVN